MTDRRDEARIETEAAIRWCGSILREVMANHGEHLTADVREAIRIAARKLGDASIDMGRAL